MIESDAEAAARIAWMGMCDLVLDNQRRQTVSAAVGLPFARVRALRRIAASSMTLGELALALGVDPPNCTPVVDDLEERGLVERQPHPTDRRSKVVVATTKGSRLAKRAQQILDRPPAVLRDLPAEDLRALAEIVTRARENRLPDSRD